MSLDEDVRVLVFVERRRHLPEVELRLGREIALVEIEENAGVEGDHDPFSDALDFRSFQLRQLLGLLVHVVADDDAGCAAHHRTDDRPGGSVARLLAHHSADHRAGGSADHGPLLLVGSRRATGQAQYDAEHHRYFRGPMHAAPSLSRFRSTAPSDCRRFLTSRVQVLPRR